MLLYKFSIVFILLVFPTIFGRPVLAEEFNSTYPTMNSCASKFLNTEIQNTSPTTSTEIQLITTIPDFTEQDGVKAAGRCDVSNFTVAVRNEGHLRAIYRDSPSKEAQNFIPDNRLNPDPEQDKAYALHLDCKNNEPACAIRLQHELNDKKNTLIMLYRQLKHYPKYNIKELENP